MDSIKTLGDEITKQLSQGTKLSELFDLMRNYNGNDWNDHVKFCKEKYAKHPVLENEHIAIFVICWEVGQFSCIHDHPENGCLMRTLSGKLIENVYANNNGQFEVCKTNALDKDGVSYIQGKNGLHNIRNGCDGKTVSLHVYSPPGHKTVFY
jgi:predicted metal-dependent enzyme (double-stranded beta helix superfamily)